TLTDNECYAAGIGISYFTDALDTAVQRTSQRESIVSSVFYCLCRNAKPHCIAIRNTEFDAGVKGTKKTIDDGYCRGSIYIIIAIDQNLFIVANGLFDTCYSLVHILHQEWIVQILQARSEKCPRLFERFDTPIDQ